MWKPWIVFIGAALLAGCASLNRLSSEVSSYGAWPAGAAARTFVFDRLPSQSAESQTRLEQAALPALTGAGFTPVPDAEAANYIVQLGASVNADALLIDDFGFYSPFGLHPGFRHRHFGVGLGFGWGWGRVGGPFAAQTYQREVVVLVRDRRTGRTVYETRAANSGHSPAIDSLLPAMFQAALSGFPDAGTVNRRRIVTTPIGG